MRLPVDRLVPVAAIILLAGCGVVRGNAPMASAPPLPTAGPGADYPMVLGEAFTIEGTTYKPVDTMNYDVVGHTAVDAEGGAAITASSKTLPLPSYVEVTALDSGTTILARVERRGPMTNARIIGLSPGAIAQLGVSGDGAPVRVRRVNPPEPERAALRNGLRTPDRIPTPKSLLTVLRRKLDGATVAVVPVPAATATPVTTTVAMPPARPASKPAPSADASGGSVVQVATFSKQDGANAVATRLGATVVPAGKFWRVRMGPFGSPEEARAALAKARAAGYSDARILRAD